MSSPAYRSVAGIVLVMVLLMTMVMTPIKGSISEKLDEGSVPGTPDSETKCTGCPSCGTGCPSCENPCNQYVPPPPPPPPPEKPPKQKCPPPPPGEYFYITGPPGTIYPFGTYYSGSGRNSAVELVVFVGCGLLLGLLAF